MFINIASGLFGFLLLLSGAMEHDMMDVGFGSSIVFISVLSLMVPR